MTTPLSQADATVHVETLLAGEPGKLAARVVEIVDRQRTLFEELETLSAEQRSLIEQRETEALLALLSRRSGVIRRLDRIDTEIRPFRARWSEVLARLEGQTRTLVQESVGQLEAVVRRVAERDEQDRQRLEEERDRAAGELASVRQGSHALHAYGNGAIRPQPRFHDREG